MDKQSVLNGLSTYEIGKHLELFDRIDSTNSYLKREALRGLPHGAVALAESQTGGRGRLGRSFSSPEGKGIYCSVLLRPNVPPVEAVDLTSYTAVALCDGIEKVTGSRPRIKWTNDLVMGGKKICGVLCEMSIAPDGSLQHVVIGFGVNVNQTPDEWPEELKAIAGSVSEVVGHEVLREKLTAELLNSLDEVYHNWLLGKREGYLEQYRKDCLTLGREIKVIRAGREEAAFAEDIDEGFGLIVRHPDGRRETVTSGEVSVRGLYGYI
ncbi:MAG: biotin--[Oscillospiraceae bacterium]|nr:biotin--[acetyl-CoA-carboxylase] ligase [Oscillospiraceae bacterium]